MKNWYVELADGSIQNVTCQVLDCTGESSFDESSNSQFSALGDIAESLNAVDYFAA